MRGASETAGSSTTRINRGEGAWLAEVIPSFRIIDKTRQDRVAFLMSVLASVCVSVLPVLLVADGTVY